MWNLVIYSSDVITLFLVSGFYSDTKFVVCHMDDSTSAYIAVHF